MTPLYSPPKSIFPVGARVLVDGRVEAIVKDRFPEGSCWHFFPHYLLDFVGGDRNTVVSMSRVGVEPAPPADLSAWEIRSRGF